jgi:hypothetical protein
VRLIKLLIVLSVLLVAGYTAGWFYITNKITSEINQQFAGQKLYVKGARGEEYYTMFDKATPTGFPFMVAAKITGWREESRAADFTYSAPIIVGYNFIKQNVFAEYDGEIKAGYKPLATGFGANLKIQNYRIAIDLPISKQLIDIARKKGDPFELLNYIGDIEISTGKVEIFDLVGGEKFYDKQYETLNFSFSPSKHYLNLQDFLSNIPNEYNAKYKVKTNVVTAEARKIPVSLFYGFFTYPSGFTANATAHIKTDAKTFESLRKNMDLEASVSFSSPLVDMPSYHLSYKGSGEDRDFALKLTGDAKIRIKEGLFVELFRHYGLLRPHLMKINPGILLDREITYVITHKDDFKFKELENSDYNLNIDLNCAQNSFRQYLKVQNFSLSSGNSAFNLKHESEAKIRKGIYEPSLWKAKGVFVINNYPSVVEFTSGYIYRFGKFRILSEEARNIYIDVNKSFLKSISDYPGSTSNDLSFEYDIDSQDMKDIKIGTVKFSNIADLYQLALYHKLLDKVGLDGDIIDKMKKLIPDIDENSKFLKEVLPKIATNKTLEKLIPKKPENVTPEEVKDIKNKIGKDLLKKLIK